MKQFVKSFAQNESGATAIEYGLIAALISIAAVAAMGSLGTKLSKAFNNIQSNIKST